MFTSTNEIVRKSASPCRMESSRNLNKDLDVKFSITQKRKLRKEQSQTETNLETKNKTTLKKDRS